MRAMFLMVALVLSSCSYPGPKFHFGDRVSFTDPFYGELQGTVQEYKELDRWLPDNRYEYAILTPEGYPNLWELQKNLTLVWGKK